MRKIIITIFFLIVILPVSVARAENLTVPEDVAPFIEPETKVIALSAADLNGDGLADYILVLERSGEQHMDKPGQRPLLILLRNPVGGLWQAKRNEKIIFCSTCGGVMGDPFQGVTAKTKQFVVSHYGGSAWRWGITYQFNYSNRDKSWQLVKVEHESFHTGEPDKMERKVETPPKDYGLIDIADFDPENYLGVGPK
jgi:hypothetical protein